MLRKLRFSFIALLVVFIFAGSVSAGTVKSYSMLYDVDQESARSMLSMINDWRTGGDAWYYNIQGQKVQCGVLSALTYDYNLEQIALQRAYEIALCFSHDRPDGTDCFTCKYNGTRSWGENIAMGSKTAADAFDQWKEENCNYNFQGHRRNMLGADVTFRAIGIAHVKVNGYDFWVQEFGMTNSGAQATAAITGEQYGTVAIDTSAMEFYFFSGTLSKVDYEDTVDLPFVAGFYYCDDTYGNGFYIPPTSITNVTWTSSDPSILRINNNKTVTAVGAGSCTLTATGVFEGKTYTCSINSRGASVNIESSADITASVPDVYFDINGVTPKPTVKYKGTTLVEGTDYTIRAYSGNNKANDNAYVQIVGNNRFTGFLNIHFKIKPVDINDVTVSSVADTSYTGSAIKPAVTVKQNGTDLRSGTDYTITYANNTNAGTATVTVKGTGSYFGEKVMNFKIKPQSVANLTFSSVSDYVYTGSAITPSVAVKNGTKTLAKDTDYTVTYSNNTEPGTASVTVKGKGNYNGTKTINFKISARNIADAVCSVANADYTGSAVTPKLEVRYSQTLLTEGQDYTVSYKNNVNPGTATATITGKGPYYTGTLTVNFNIVKFDYGTVKMSEAKFVLAKDIVEYTGSAIKPALSVTYGDHTYIEGTDYSVSYSDNINAGICTVTVKGINGNLEGSKSDTFTIKSKSILDLTIEPVPDQKYTGSPITPNVTIKHGTKTLVKDVDYTLVHTNNTYVTTNANITINGKGNYSGCTTVTFEILPILTWKSENGKWYLLYSNGVKKTGFAKMDGKTYYMDSTGAMVTGWQKIDSSWYYFNTDGSMATGWKGIGGKWYCFTASGIMMTGWNEIDGKWYYFNDGAMVTGWKSVSGKWYYFNTDGSMVTGWKSIKNKWYYFNSDGSMVSGWKSIGGVWYYFNKDGDMVTGWKKIDGEWYYFESSGAMKTRWLYTGGKWYYLGTNGIMVHSTSLVIGGKTYEFDTDGICLNP